MKILDLGCGQGNNTYRIYDDKNEVTGVDIDINNVNACKLKFPKHNFIQIDGEKLPFENEVFDMIHCVDVLEHVDDLDKVLIETKRVLRAGGEFLIEVPYWRSEKMLLKINPNYRTQIHHVRMFKTGEMEIVLGKYGFFLKKSKYLKFIDNIILSMLFLTSDGITGQVGSFTNKKTKARVFARKIIRGVISVINPIFYPLDQLFPKSVYFLFEKK